MQIKKTEILRFANSIPDRCKSERDKILKVGQGKWDTYVRKNFAKTLEGWFCEYFGVLSEESKKYVYAEGYNPIPPLLRGNAFFGTTIHPDAAIIVDDKPLVAIELDHGTKGSQIRNALAKASFSFLLGRFEKALLLFFVDQPSVKLEHQVIEENILKIYEQHFKTTLFIL